MVSPFQNSSALSFIVNDTFERLARPFPLPSQSKVVVAAGEYRYPRAALDYSSNRGLALSGSVKVSAGEFWEGHSQVAEGGIELRPSDHVDMNLTVSRNQVYLPAGDWYDYEKGWRFEGKRGHLVPVTLEGIPIFARGGAFFTCLSSQLIVSASVCSTDSRAA